MTLEKLRPGQRATVLALRLREPLRRRLEDLGLAEGTEIRCLGRSPLGDPAAFLICGSAVALRRADCRRIDVEG